MFFNLLPFVCTQILIRAKIIWIYEARWDLTDCLWTNQLINREADFNQTLRNNPSLITRVNDVIIILSSPERDVISFSE